MLLLQGRGFRPIELVIAAFVGVIGLCYLIELFDRAARLGRRSPSTPWCRNSPGRTA